MTQEEALNIIESALSPESLTPLQINVFQRAWNKLSYEKIAMELNHDYSYITDIGAQLWRLLSQKLKIKVTKVRLQNALARYAQQEQGRNLSALSLYKRVDWADAPDTSQFCGRQEQLNLLEQWVVQDNCRAIAVAGMGGIGKTMLVARLAQQLAERDMFDVVLWRSLQQSPPFADFLTELMSAIAPEQPLPLRLDAKVRQLLEQLRHRRCLLILDGVEGVMQGGELVGTYQPGCEAYGLLFQQLGAGRHQSTVLLTSREIPPEIAIGQGVASQVRLLRLNPLSSRAGKVILAGKGLTSADQAPVEELIKRYQGNPLMLKIVATPIRELFNSNIAAFLAQEALLFTEIRGLLTQQFNRLSSLERQVMYWLAINREAVTAAQLQADITPSVSLVEVRDALVSLDRRSLIEKIKLTSVQPTIGMELDYISYTQQPVVMEYVTEQFIQQVCQEVEQAQIVCLRSHALLKAQTKDYVRIMQIRLIVQPILARLLEIQGGSENLKQLLQLLKVQQSQAPLQPRYFAENALHLLRQLGADLSHLDLSNLMIWQTGWQMMNLHETTFNYAKPIVTNDDSDEVNRQRWKDGQQTATFRGITSWLESLVFSPNIAKLWDMYAKECLKIIAERRHQGWLPTLTFVFSPQAVAIWLWDIRSGQINYWIASVAFSAKERCLGNEDETFANKLITFTRTSPELLPNYSNYFHCYN